jgi:hypothetical protein
LEQKKPRIVKDYDALPEDILAQIKLAYPYGFVDNLISFYNKEGKRVSALPFEAEEIYYLVRMTSDEAENIIENDDDYDDEGNLTDDAREGYEDKYGDDEDSEEIDESIEDDD